MRRSDAYKPYAALMLILATLAGPRSGSAAEKTELRLLDQRSAVSMNDCTHELFRPDGSKRKIEDPGCTAVLSPDGTRIALRSHDSKIGLVIYNADKDEYSFAITFLAGTDVGKFVWSPDSSAVAFTTVNQDAADYPTQSKLFLYTVSTKKKIKFDVQAFRSCGGICIASTPEWSPDGKMIKLVEVDRQKMLEGSGPYERDVEFDRNGARFKSSSWR